MDICSSDFFELLDRMEEQKKFRNVVRPPIMDSIDSDTLRQRYAECRLFFFAFVGYPRIEDKMLDIANEIRRTLQERGQDV